MKSPSHNCIYHFPSVVVIVLLWLISTRSANSYRKTINLLNLNLKTLSCFVCPPFFLCLKLLRKKNTQNEISLRKLRRFSVHISKSYRKVAAQKPIRYVLYHFQHRSVSKPIRYKNRAELFVLDVNRRPIRYAFHNGTKTYPV